MRLIEFATVITGAIPYLLLIVGISKGTIKQSFATWMLWLILDVTVLKGIIDQHGNALLFWIFASGTLLVTLFLIIKKQFSWGRFESFVGVLVMICILVYIKSGPYTATIATTIALDIAGIPQIIETYKRPKTTPTVSYLFFTISSVLSVYGANAYTVQDMLPQTNAAVFCFIITLLSIRKPKSFYK